MKAVNLLPRELEPQRKAPPVAVVVGCAGAVAAAAVLAFAYLQASSQLGSENRQLAAVQAQIAALPSPPAPPATVSSLPQERASRLAAVASALSQRVAWDRILREISLVMPDDVWLTSLDATSPSPALPAGTPAPAPSDPPTGVTLSGFTYSQAGVARLLARLGVLPDLAAVSLTSSTQSAVGTRSVISFTVAADVREQGASS